MDSPYFYVGEKRLAPKWTQSAFIVESSLCPHDHKPEEHKILDVSTCGHI